MGMVAARQGRDADAEAAFLEALDDAGDFACPYEGLGLLYLQQGRADDAVPLLEAALEQAPDPERAQALREALEAVKSEP